MTFHWAILLPENSVRARRLHAGQSLNWTYEVGDQSLIRVPGTIQLLTIVVRLGSLIETGISVQHFERVISSIPGHVMPINEDKCPCRTWFHGVVKELDDLGMLTCQDVEGLEKELTHLAMLQEASERKPPAHFISGLSK